MKYSKEFRDPQVAARFLEILAAAAARLDGVKTLMEVCGTHTMAIHRHGIRSLLPTKIRLISGPGCPVCVTPVDFVDKAVALSRLPDVIIATFGDMVRVPGSTTSLLKEKAQGIDLRIVYSPADAVALAARNPSRRVVFLGVGFETTAPTVAASILQAEKSWLENYFVLCAHKTIPEAMALLGEDPEIPIDGYLCPAHVSAVIGTRAYASLATEHAIPCVVTGFEPLDILQGVALLVHQILDGRAEVENQYSRFVRREGNPKAMEILHRVFEPCDARWRGLGTIPGSGLRIREEFAAFDIEKRLTIAAEPAREPSGCCCGEVLKGKIAPRDCPLVGTLCTPEEPVGACMVSNEGACAAAYRYGA